MEENWLGFVRQEMARRPRTSLPAHRPRPNVPWGLYTIYLIIAVTLAIVFIPWERLTGRAQMSTLQSQLTNANNALDAAEKHASDSLARADALQGDLVATQQRIASLEAALQSRASAPPTTPPSVSPSPSAPNLSPADRATTLEIWNSVHEDCMRGFIETYNALDLVLNDWPRKVMNNREGLLSSLSNADNGMNAGATCVTKLLDEYPTYKDIAKILTQPYTGRTQKAIEEFAGAINELPPTLPADFDVRLRPYAGEVKVEATYLVNWIGDINRIAGVQIKELSGRR